MDVTFLGTGAPLHPGRAATGMVVTAEGCAPLLIDTCGGFELAQKLSAAGFNIADLKHVIVTHRHLDHTGGMMALYLANMPLEVHALADTHAGIAAIKAGCFPEWEPHPQVEHHEVEAGDSREIGGFQVRFFAVEHRVPTVAVRVSAGGRTFAFGADSLACDALVQAARSADLFACDAICAESDGETARTRAQTLMHTTARQAAEIAAHAEASRLACVHIGRFGSAANILAEASAAFGRETRVPDDGARWQF